MKKKLLEIREKIIRWKDVITKYPKSNSFKEILYKLQQEEADLINRIGRRR